MLRPALSLLLCGALSLLAGCKRAPDNATPEGAVRALLGALEAMATEPARAGDALALLGPQTTKNLEARALRASKVEGRTLSSTEYLSDVRYLPRARPSRFVAERNVSEQQALVHVFDEEGREISSLPVFPHNGLWLVELGLPELPALQKRGQIQP